MCPLRGQESAGIVTCDGADPPTYTAHKVIVTSCSLRITQWHIFIKNLKSHVCLSSSAQFSSPSVLLFFIQAVCVKHVPDSFLFYSGNGISEHCLPPRGSSEAAPRDAGYLPHSLLHHGGLGAAELPALCGGHDARQSRRGTQRRAGECSRSAEKGEPCLRFRVPVRGPSCLATCLQE